MQFLKKNRAATLYDVAERPLSTSPVVPARRVRPLRMANDSFEPDPTVDATDANNPPPPLNSSRDYAVATPSMGSSVNTHSFPRLYTAMHLLPTRQVAVMMGVGSYRYRSGYAAMSASVASFA